MGKYNDVMNKIEVTEEMRSRILQNIADEFKDEEFKDEEFKAEKSKGEDAIVRDLESDNDNTIDFKSIRVEFYSQPHWDLSAPTSLEEKYTED